MSPTSQQIGENVTVLMFRRRINNTQLAAEVGLTRMTLGNRILGKTPWTADELPRVAQALGVTVAELYGQIPDFKEWQRRRSAPAEPLRAVSGPRFLVMPEDHADEVSPTAVILKKTDSARYVIAQWGEAVLALLSGTVRAVLWLVGRRPNPDPLTAPYAALLDNLDTRATSCRVQQPIRVASLASTYRTRVALSRGLTRDAQSITYLRPGQAPQPRRRDVLNRCIL